MSVPTLIIAGVEIAFQQAGDASQTYEPLGARATHRMADGSAFRQTLWSGRLRTLISGQGWVPVGLAGVDWDVPVQIDCIAPRVLHAGVNVLALPVARRPDAPVRAIALKAGQVIRTACAVLDDVATATPVAGASAYQFFYLPRLSCYSDGPSTSHSRTSGAHGWQLTAEEI